MAVTMPWAEQIVVGMSLGFPVNVFTLDSATDGILDTSILDGALVAQASNRVCAVSKHCSWTQCKPKRNTSRRRNNRS
jgi:hypothetical protein